MRIDKINKIKNLRSFKKFYWPSDLLNFGVCNLFYGWNGSGKTTLTNIFRAIEKKQSVSEGEVEMITEGRRIDGNNIPNETTLPNVRVFNEDFVVENVFTSHGSVTPIFYLGEENIEKQKKVDELKKRYEKKREKLSEKQKEKSIKNNETDTFCKDMANNTIKPLLRSAGSNPYNNYNKTDFRNQCEELSKEKDTSTYILDDSDEDKLKKQKEATPKDKISKLSFVFSDFKSLHSEAGAILDQTVVSQVLEELRDDQELAGWVKAGLKKHKKESADICLFCGQRLPEGRIHKLEAHFNDQYNTFISTIGQKIKAIEDQISICDTINIPDKAKLYDHLAESYLKAVSKLNEQISCQKKALGELQKHFKEKKDKPFQSLTLDLSLPDIDPSKLDFVNQIISNHNQETDNFEKSVTTAREKLEKSIVAKSLPDYREKKKAIVEVEQVRLQTQKELDELTPQIEKLKKEIIEHRKPAEELNNDLKNYLGRDELKFKVMDTGYQLVRKDQIAYALSEGERGAIAFLYFLKSLSDKKFNLRNGVVVIDDPVSSLDSNSLFYAFSFMKEQTKKVGQLFIFTHNFSFFRQVKNWFHHLKGQNRSIPEERPARFYMVVCNREVGSWCSTITKIDPLLERYDSEYHYLFSLIFKESQKQIVADLQNYYHLPNVARRLLEAFLSFKRPGKAGELKNQLDSIDFNSEKKIRILRFLHTHSHNGQIDEPEHDFSILSETPQVLSDVLDLIKSEDKRHYEEMLSLLPGLVTTSEGMP